MFSKENIKLIQLFLDALMPSEKLDMAMSPEVKIRDAVTRCLADSDNFAATNERTVYLYEQYESLFSLTLASIRQYGFDVRFDAEGIM